MFLYYVSMTSLLFLCLSVIRLAVHVSRSSVCWQKPGGIPPQRAPLTRMTIQQRCRWTCVVTWMVTSLYRVQYEARAPRRFTGVLQCVYNMFTAHRSEKSITYGNYCSSDTCCRFSFFYHCQVLIFLRVSILYKRYFPSFWSISTVFVNWWCKKFPNTYAPLTHSSVRVTVNIHPLNGTCHDSACPLTKDNCDLDKH